MFRKEKNIKDQIKQNDRELRKVGRTVERDRRELERDEKKLEMEIKRLAKQPGNKDAVKILAKQLIQIRKQKTRTYVANSKISSISAQQKSMGANVKMADAMTKATTTMGNMNKIMDPQKMAKTMQDFEKASAKMGMTDEIVNDTLDDILNESGDEEESDAIVNKVLEEIGIEIGSKVAGAPSAQSDTIGTSQGVSEEEIEETLARLRAA